MRSVFLALLLPVLASLCPAQNCHWTEAGALGHVTDFTVSPDYEQSGTVWALPGVDDLGGLGPVLYSQDRGESFQVISTLSGPSTFALYTIGVSPQYPLDPTLFVQGFDTPYGELWRSTDGALSWQKMPREPWSSTLYTLALSPDFANDQFLYCGAVTKGLGYYSEDAGQNWTIVSGYGSFRGVAFSSDVATSGWAYATDFSRFQRSADGGRTWKQCASYGAVPCAALYYHHGVVCPPVGPNGERFAYVYGQGSAPSWPDVIQRSQDNAMSFYRADSGITGSVVYSIAFAPDFWQGGAMYAGTDQGVFVSFDQGTTYAAVSNGGLPTGANGHAVKLAWAGDVDGDLYALVGDGSWDKAGGRLFKLEFDGDLCLDISPDPTVAGDVLEFAVSRGASFGWCLLYMIDVNSIPFLFRIPGPVTFDAAGDWQSTFVTPPGLSGIEAGFVGLGATQAGKGRSLRRVLRMD